MAAAATTKPATTCVIRLVADAATRLNSRGQLCPARTARPGFSGGNPLAEKRRALYQTGSAWASEATFKKFYHREAAPSRLIGC